MRLLPCGDRAILVEVGDAASAGGSTPRCAAGRSRARSSTSPALAPCSSWPGPEALPQIAAALRDLVLDDAAPERTGGRGGRRGPLRRSGPRRRRRPPRHRAERGRGPAHRPASGPSSSPASHRDSCTWPAPPGTSRCPGGSRRAPAYRPVRWDWPARTPGSTPGRRPVAGRSSAGPTCSSGTPTATHRPCSPRGNRSASSRCRRERPGRRGGRPAGAARGPGRPGHAALGVSESGAADRRALRLANRLLGNAEGTAALEVLMGGLAVRAEGAVRVCVTGAPAPVTVDGRAARLGVPVDLRDGQLLALGMPPTGLRTYVAVQGGWTSRGPGEPEHRPDHGGRTGTASARAAAARRAPRPRTTRHPRRRGRAGTPAGHRRRAARGPRSPRRLVRPDRARRPDRPALGRHRRGRPRRGPAGRAPARPRRRPARELPSEGVVRGAVQVPHSGQPLVFLADHPTTGGYPVMAVVVDDDTDVLAQLRPGERVRFRRVPRGW